MPLHSCPRADASDAVKKLQRSGERIVFGFVDGDAYVFVTEQKTETRKKRAAS